MEKITTGTQIQSNQEDSLIGNKELCGSPLTQNCVGEGGKSLSQQAYETPYFHERSSIDWNLLSVELGYICSYGVFFRPLIFLKRWRIWYSKNTDE